MDARVGGNKIKSNPHSIEMLLRKNDEKNFTE